MPTLKKWIEDLTDGQPVEAVVIGEMGWGDYKSETVPNYVNQPRGVVLTWEQALPWISYGFEEGVGAPGCNAVHAWTQDWIISVLRFDGLTEPFRIPRHPMTILPEMPGGRWVQDRPDPKALLGSTAALFERVDKDLIGGNGAVRELTAKVDGLNEAVSKHVTEARAAVMWALHYIRERMFAEARAARDKAAREEGESQ